MCISPFSSMTTAKTYEIGRIAHLPCHTKYDAAVNAAIAKMSNDNQFSNVNVPNGKNGYLSRIASTVGLYIARKSVNASSAT